MFRGHTEGRVVQCGTDVLEIQVSGTGREWCPETTVDLWVPGGGKEREGV